uniref:Cysteine protease n=1 Tax=Schistocephalus solidus TaxID=70667 RepID=A0A183STT6_SCHSO
LFSHPASHPSSWYHRQIIRWFGDTPAASSPFSIHRLVQASGSPPGACLGPATLCRALVISMALAGQMEPLLREIEIYLARDRVICTEEVLDLFNNCPHPSPSSDGEGYSFTDHTGNYRPADTNEVETRCQSVDVQVDEGHLVDARAQSADTTIHPQASTTPIHPPVTAAVAPPLPARRLRRGLLLLVPMRLGAGSRIDTLYTSTFLHLLRDPACVGAVGGRPRHSVYMTGSQNDRLIYLDPHLYQEAVSVEGQFFNPSSWHCSTPRLMPIKHLDPSCAFGFYCGSRMELVQLLERLPRISELRSPHRSNTRLIEVVSASQATYLFSPPVTSLPIVHAPSLAKDSSHSYSYPPIDDSGEHFDDHRQHFQERDEVFL